MKNGQFFFRADKTPVAVLFPNYCSFLDSGAPMDPRNDGINDDRHCTAT